MQPTARHIMLQTSDDHQYSQFLTQTNRSIGSFCANKGIEHSVFKGIKRGFHPWQATFNRIALIEEIFAKKQYDWLMYLDADAFIYDMNFDIVRYLREREEFLLIASRGLNKGKWDVNAGVFFLNLKHPSASTLILEWNRLFLSEVSDDLLRKTDKPWGFKPNDQDLLQTVLRENLDAWDKSILIEKKELINSPSGSFIRQILRRDAETLQDRIEMVRVGVAEAESLYFRGANREK